MCLKKIHLGFVDTLKGKITKYYACLNITVIYIFQNTWTRGCHVYMSMIVVR